ncbi:hypothetical protein JCM13580A_50860 [Streptomyces drozdowiczii]
MKLTIALKNAPKASSRTVRGTPVSIPIPCPLPGGTRVSSFWEPTMAACVPQVNAARWS